MMKCNVCNRVFKTKASLAQHKKDYHVPKSRTRPPRRGRSGVGGGGVDVAPSRTRAAPGGVFRLNGEDRLASVVVKKETQTIVSYPVGAFMSPRLGTVSRAFQRLRWDKLVVRVVPQAPLTVKGGYVAGFVMDPADLVVTASSLISHQGSIQKKLYETSILRMPQTNTLFFTSASEEIRLQEPGIFWFITDGAPAEDITVIITVEWEVSLSYPSLEVKVENSVVVPYNISSYANNYNLKHGDSQDFSSMMAGIVNSNPNVPQFFLRVPTFTIEYSEGTGDTGTLQMHYLVYTVKDKKMYYSNNGADKSTVPWQSDVEAQIVVAKGVTAIVVPQGN